MRGTTLMNVASIATYEEMRLHATVENRKRVSRSYTMWQSCGIINDELSPLMQIIHVMYSDM